MTLALVLTLPASLLAHEGYRARIAELDLAIQLEPHHVGYRLERAGLRLSLGSVDQAVLELESLGEVARNEPDWWLLLAEGVCRQGRAARCAQVADEGLQRSGSIALLRWRWLANDALGALEAAADDCQRWAAWSALPDDVVACSLLLRQCERDERPLLVATLARRPDPLVREALVEAHSVRGAWPEALAAASAGHGIAWDVRRVELLVAAGDPRARSEGAEVLRQVRERRRRRPVPLLDALQARIERAIASLDRSTRAATGDASR